MQQEEKLHKKYYQVHGNVGLFIELILFNTNKFEFHHFIYLPLKKTAAFKFIINLMLARCSKTLKCKLIFNLDKLEYINEID